MTHKPTDYRPELREASARSDRTVVEAAPKVSDYGREVRDTIVKSSLTGVAATVLAVTVFSPAGFGGLVGTSLASGFGLDTNNSAGAAEDPYANLPAYPAPLTSDELRDIHNQLARTTASLEITRAATEAKIEAIRSIALTGDLVTFTPVTQTASVEPELRLQTSQPEALAAAAPAPMPASTEAAPAPIEAAVTPVSYSGGIDPNFRDPHLELADLLLAHETF
jgi:hypothetical protein